MDVLPNPAGTDAGHETVTLQNFGAAPVDLAGWRLIDRAEHTFTLDETLAPAATHTFTLPVTAGGQSMLQLNNSGDDVRLVNAEGTTVHEVTYSGLEAMSGQVVARGPQQP